MKILITDRKGIENLSLKPFEVPSALISITDYEYSFANLKYKPKYILQLAFDDVPVGDGFEEEYGRRLNSNEIKQLEHRFHSMSEKQTNELISFYNKVKSKVELMICQCEHGQSRSAAIAAAFSEHAYGNAIGIFSDDRYYPNKSIFRKVLRKLKSNSADFDSTHS